MRKTKARKNPKTGKWDIQYRYTDWQGKSLKSTKRGFPTKKAAEEYLRHFLSIKHVDFDMKFAEFVEVYYQDMEQRLRYHTMLNKKYIMEKKVLPYFGNMRMNQIKVATIRAWQNELMKQGYSATYLRTINNQVSALFNYAVRYYDLSSNPCRRAGSMGKNTAEEMNFWTKEEFNQFVECLMDKHQSYMAFTTLYWTGIRIGELLALTLQDVDFEKKTISINKSYQRLGGKDIITPPKTPKSKRLIHIPQSLVVDLKEYTDSLYGIEATDRIFVSAKRKGVIDQHLTK